MFKRQNLIKYIDFILKLSLKSCLINSPLEPGLLRNYREYMQTLLFNFMGRKINQCNILILKYTSYIFNAQVGNGYKI